MDVWLQSMPGREEIAKDRHDEESGGEDEAHHAHGRAAEAAPDECGIGLIAVGEAARGVRDATRGTVEGFQEGVGGSGSDADIGDKDGVIDDGEGPFEQPARPGEDKGILNDGKGPLDEAKNR